MADKNNARKKRIIIDCDPGLDDAAALLLAFQLENINLLGIMTVHKNINKYFFKFQIIPRF